jgi:hypothetical protein
MHRFFALALVAGLVVISPAVAEDSKKSDDGWVTIFDGKSLDGWKKNENPNSIRLEDGKIVTNGPRSHLFYVGDDKPFKNFEFEAEVLTKENSNAGIFFHTKFQEEGWPAQGYEAQVNNTYNKDPQKTGGLYNTVKVLEAPAKDNEWFKYYIKVQGRHVIVKINDKTVVDYEQPADKAQPALSEGTFALQAHDPGSTVYFRNIRVKRLPD